MLIWIKELLTEFTPRALKVTISVIAVVALGTYIFTSGLSASNKVTISKSQKVTSSESTEVVVPKIYVHVAGSVKNPGIYQLDSGERVFGAVLAAGGFSGKANQSSVNMARVLNDGEQLLIGSTDSPSAYSESSTSTLLSLNQSSATQLEDLPGVGPALAGRIVDWRTANGGFKSKEDLLNVSGIGDKLFAGVKDLVTL